MGEIDKARIRRDAQRTAAGRQTAAQSRTEQALLRYLGVEMYEASRPAQGTPDKPETEHSTGKE